MRQVFNVILGLTLTLFTLGIQAQPNRIDLIRPAAPELAQFGDHDIGVRSLEWVNPDQLDIASTPLGGATPRYDRPLPLEAWYPARLGPEQSPGGSYVVMTRDGETRATLTGRAVRDADPLTEAGPFPLVIISHGHPGNRFLLSHLGENLASKGYVVLSVDHTDSTYDSAQLFTSTLYHRPLDQRFVLAEAARLAKTQGSFLFGLVDAERTGIVGYSMGGYGLMNNLGAPYREAAIESFGAPPNGALREHTAANPAFADTLDERIKAGVAVAPWGMEEGYFSPEGLAGVTVPTLYVVGDKDRTVGYEAGPRALWNDAVNSDRYLLTFKNAGHNAGAPIPLPMEVWQSEEQAGAGHYTDPVWDTVTMNNIMDHFITAFFAVHLQGDLAMAEYLDLAVADGAEAVYSMRRGVAQEDHSYWPGFSAGTAVGLKLEFKSRGQ